MAERLPPEQVERTKTALDELESGEMAVEPAGDGTFDVKGYTVDLAAGTCTCNDFRYRTHYCKHVIGAKLQSMWGNLDLEAFNSHE